jgi:hypothetical protein
MRKKITIAPGGYNYILNKEHPRANNRGRVFEHIVVCEEILRKPLPMNAVIHHMDENRRNNKKDNLVICQDRSYHTLLHIRLRSLMATGRTDLLLCTICKKYLEKESFLIDISKSSRSRHSTCKNCQKIYRENNRESLRKKAREYYNNTYEIYKEKIQNRRKELKNLKQGDNQC